jgi:hypothetical protein
VRVLYIASSNKKQHTLTDRFTASWSGYHGAAGKPTSLPASYGPGTKCSSAFPRRPCPPCAVCITRVPYRPSLCRPSSLHSTHSQPATGGGLPCLCCGAAGSMTTFSGCFPLRLQSCTTQSRLHNHRLPSPQGHLPSLGKPSTSYAHCPPCSTSGLPCW